MRIGFYPKLAAGDIRKNRRLFLPYILTCVGMVMMFYIIMFLALSDALTPLNGAETLRQVFALGSWVIAIFAGIFLFYTNSFLIRRRKKEFGLYNILGMGKREIGHILFWETLFTALLAMSAGLAAGIAFSKLAELGLINVMHGEAAYDLTVSALSIRRSVQVFGVIFLLLFLNSVRQVRFASAISLIRSENIGEKPPKGNWVLGVAGALLLAAAYGMAVTIQDPLEALMAFFVAVVMVIAGTYLVMMAGSVLFCRLLQKKKSYYYKSSHFVSVASMAYRMKRNGAGLASICILATMALVTMASTACLYFGEESVVRGRYPREINLEFQMPALSGWPEDKAEALRAGISEELAACGVSPQNDYFYRYAQLYGVLQEDYVELDADKLGDVPVASLAESRSFYFVPLADYNAMMGTDETLEEGEALIYLDRGEYAYDTITFRHGKTLKIRKQVEEFLGNGESAANMATSITLIVPDLEKAVEGPDMLADFNGSRMLREKWLWNLDTGLEPERQIQVYRQLVGTLTDPSVKERLGYVSCVIECQENERTDFFSLFGALFYIGIILSAAFVLAAVLIIYYKQVSEGYEDQARFEIMQKVGMTKQEIRKSINSQLLTVFFLPLVFAATHVAFAFPIIRKILLAFSLNNVELFAATTAVSILAFALFYTIVYRLTSNAYYNIVSRTE